MLIMHIDSMPRYSMVFRCPSCFRTYRCGEYDSAVTCETTDIKCIYCGKVYGHKLPVLEDPLCLDSMEINRG
jgi:hypothetical protein